MKTLLFALVLAVATPTAAFAAAVLHAPQAVIDVPGGMHGIGFDDIGYAAPLHRVTIPAGATGNLVLLNPATRASTVISGVSASAPGAAGRREGTTSAIYADGYLFASDHDPAEVVAIDPATYAVVGRTLLAAEPDYLRYVARTHEIWVTEPSKQQIQVFRLTAAPKAVLAPETLIHVAGGPESLEIDNARDRAYTNLWKGKTVVVDLTAHRVVAEWPNGCARSHGIAIDEARDHVFVACGDGKVVTLAPAQKGRVIGSATAGAGVDIISYSPRLHRLYVPGARAATLTIFDVADAGTLHPVAIYQTAKGAHCVTNDDAGHVFVCDPAAGTILEMDDR